MAFLYLTEQGAVLGKKGRRVVVRKAGEVLLDIPCHKIDGVMVFGNVQVSTQALALLLQNDIELAFFSRRGRLRGQITSPFTKNIELRIAQYDRYRQPAFRLRWAKAVVGAKIGNCRRLVAGFRHNHPGVDFGAALRQLKQLIRQVEEQTHVDGLLGVEGRAARVYFDAFGKMLLADMDFGGRRKRPPPDPVNALLSFSYTLLFTEVASLLDGMGFDPYLGFFHAVRYGRASLAADLMEEFRAPVADRFVLRALNRKVLGKSDFFKDPLTGGCHLRKDALGRYFLHWDRWLENEPGTAGEVGQAGYRRLFRRQAEAAVAAVVEDGDYQPYSTA